MLQRTELLDVEHMSVDWDMALGDLSVPMLRSFTLLRRSNVDSPLAALYCSSATPRLVQLHLVGLRMQWSDTFRHPNLTSLSVESDGHDCGSTSTEGLLAALESMPALEHLELRKCFPNTLPLARSFDRMVALTQLRSIKLVAQTITCANLICYLQISLDYSVRLFGEFGGAGVVSLGLYMNERHLAQHMMVSKELRILPLNSRIIDTKDSRPWSLPELRVGVQPDLTVSNCNPTSASRMSYYAQPIVSPSVASHQTYVGGGRKI